MFNDLYLGPMLGIVHPSDKVKHWTEMQKYFLLPLIEMKGEVLKIALPLFPPELQSKIKSVIITVGYTKPYTA